MTRIGPRAGGPRATDGARNEEGPTRPTAGARGLRAPDTVRAETSGGGRPAYGARRAGLLDARAKAPPPRVSAARIEATREGLVGHVLGEDGPPRPVRGAAEPGAVLLVESKPGRPLRPTGEVLAKPGTVKAKLYAIAEAEGLSPTFPPEVVAEVRALMAAPGIDDPSLEDWTDKAFITIDNADSRDLDQAVHIERRPDGGYRVAYALADAAYYVRPGTALHREAMKRGVTYYFPGFSVPMLPPELSEGIVSLNEGEDRRALMVVTDLDAEGRVEDNRFARGRIQSRAKLSYDGVQAYHQGDPALAGRDFTETLDLLREVGEKRAALSEERDVVRVHREEARASVDPADPTGFVIEARGRNEVEKWNEQISLLCNSEGAKFMEAPGNAPWVTPIYKVHPSPVKKRERDFAELLDGIVEAHELDPATWSWRPGGDESLADYLARLPLEGPRAGISKAIHRQAVMINRASEFSAEPGEHHGIGVEPYARFSSPMREMVGIHTHKEALEKLSGEPPPGWVRESEASRAEMVEIANATKSRQRKIEKAADKLVLDHILGTDLERPEGERPLRQGTILGTSAKKVYVRFDDPPLEVKLYVPDLEAAGAKLELSEDRAMLRSTDPEALPDLRIGDPIAVRVSGYDDARDHYRFALAER